MGVKERYEAKNKNSKSNSVAVKTESTMGVKERYEAKKEKRTLQNTINFDTLQSDLTSLSKTIDSVYNGWQTKETMENTRSSVQSMYDRLGKYQEYQKKYGGTDLSDLQSAYKSVLDDWDDISKHYGKYENASAYKNALKEAEKQAAEYEGMKTADLGSVQTEIKDLEEILKTAKEYQSEVNGLHVKKNTWEHRSGALKTDGGYSDKLKAAESEYNSFLKNIGYKSIDDIEKALGEKRVYLGKAQRLQDSIALSSVADVNSENYDKDFDKYAEKGKALGKEKNEWWNGGGTYKNQIAYMRENPDYLETYEDTADDNGKIVESITMNQLPYLAAKYMTDDEANIYNYYVGKNDEEGAENYLKAIEETLKQRQGNAIYEERDSMFSKYTFGYTAGIDQFTQGIINEFNTKDNYIPTTGIQNASGLVREDIQYEHGTLGQVGYDLINTTSNMMPSILTSTVVSAVATPIAGQVVGAGLMGTSAAGNAYQEMLNLGYDKSQARTYSNLVGLSEAGLQYLMGGIGKLGGVSGKLSKIVSGIDNGLAKFAIRWGGSALSEGFEEAAQEVLNPLFTNIAAGYDTGADVDWSEVVYSGLLGALSGGFLEGGDIAVNTYAETSFNKNMGQNIRANERISEVFDIASNPEVASAYETYTHYANKGVNADNISDAQLGRLYTESKLYAQDTLKSKKSTGEQKTEALKTLARLSVVETENTIKKEAKKFNVGEETKVTESGDAVDIKDLKVKGDEVTVATEKGEISVEDITLTQNDAEFVAFAKEISKSEGEDVANLFVSQYDGVTNVEEYANAFNLTTEYAKNNFSYDHILRNKGVLSTEQVKAIYRETRIKADKEKATYISKLNEKMADKKFYKGFIDESVIDYENTSAEGKVNWDSLNARQKQAVIFIKGFAQATGMNLVLEHNPDGKYNGKFEVNSNTITIDISNPGKAFQLRETIIPTMSHETTHWMKEKSPELWRNLNEIVFATLTEHYNSNTEQAIKDKISLLDKLDPRVKHTEEDAKGKIISEEDIIRAEQNSKGKSEEESREEIIARACEDMLKMSERGKRIFTSLSENDRKTLVEKLKGLVNDLLNWVNDLLNSYESTSTEARIMREYKEQLQKAAKVWDEMLGKSIKANQSLEKSGKYGHDTSVESEVVFCERSDSPSAFNPDGLTLREQLIQAFDESESKERRYVYVGEFTQSFVDKLKEHIKIERLPIVMNYRDAYLSMKSKEDGKYQGEGINYHNLGVDGLEAALKSFDNPEYVLLSTKENKIELILEGRDYKNRQLFSIVEVNTAAQHNKEFLPAHVVNSVYGNRGLKNRIAKAESEGRVIYNKKEESTQGMPQVQYERDINVNSSKDSIPNPNEKVKTKYSNRDTEYLELAKDPVKNEARLREMVYEAAKEKGYTDDSSWRMGHTAPNSRDDVSLDNLKESGLIPDDFWEHPEWYTHSYEERESYYKVKKAIEIQERRTSEGNPRDAYMWVYRAVDKTKNKREDYFRNGDWVTPSKEYAIREGKMNPNGYRIIKHSVSIKNLYWDGNSIAELGYDDGNNYAYADTLNNRKLLDPVTYYPSGEIIPLSKRFNRRDYDVRFSERDAEYMNAVESGDIETAQRMVDDVAEMVGYNIRAYHGTSRADRVGNVFLPERATSGPMAFFTDNKEIAENYAKTKQDTSMAYDPDYDSYETQFRVKMKNMDIPLYRAWGYLPFDARNRITQKAQQLREDWDGDGGFILDPNNKEANGGFQWQLKMARGNTLLALNEQWLNSGNLFNEESRFLEVLEMAGVMEEFKKIGDIYFKDPNARHEKVYDTYLRITNPFDTSLADNSFVDGLISWYEEQDESKYSRESMESDLWDKNSIDAYEFADRVRSDIENGTFHAWTSIPDSVTDYLKSLDYDGIKDLGGKHSDVGHTVWIPFSSEQIKSSEPVTYDDNGNVIPLSQRFNLENNDIRYSDRDSDRDYSYKSMIAKPDAEVTTLKAVTPLEESKYKSDYDLFAKDMRDVASKKGNPKNTAQKTYLYCKDLGEDVLITKQSFKHGAARIDNAYISVCKSIADILNTSIVVNELTEREKTNGAYVLLGLAENKDSYVVVRSIVNKKTWKLEEYEELYAIKKKSIQKGDVGLKAPALHLKSGYGTSPTISIANFLNFVNSQSLGSSVLSLDVVKNLHSQRAFDENVTPYLLYSERDTTSVYDIMGETDRILKENENFKEEIERLKERLKIERRVTKGSILNNNQLLAAAGHLRNISNSTIDKVDLARSLKDVYSFIAESKNLTWEEVYERCHNIAESMLEKSKPEVMVDDYYKQLLKDIRGSRISLSESQKREAQNAFDKNWNRYFFNRVTIAENGTGIDVKWQEWADKYPGIFDTEISDGDMIVELYNIINTARDASEVVVEYDMAERTRWLANEIYNQYWNVSPIRTTADKYDKQIKRLNAEHRRAMAELRDDYNSRLKEQHKADKEKYKELAQKIRERKDKEIALAKKHGRDMMDKYKTNAERKTTIQSITANALSLNDMLVKNSKDKHIPEVMRENVTALLQAIDFSSKKLIEKGEPTMRDRNLAKALRDVNLMLVKATPGLENALADLYGSGLDEKTENLVKNVDSILETIGDKEFVLNKMSLEDLNELNYIVKVFKHTVNRVNKFHIAQHNAGISDLALQSSFQMDELGEKGFQGDIKKFMSETYWNNKTPYYAFKHYGEAATKILNAFQDGQDKMAFLSDEVITFTNSTFTEEEARKWEKQTYEFTVEQRNGKKRTFKLNLLQIMELYCVSKQEDAYSHLSVGGITIKEQRESKVAAVTKNILLEIGDFQKIVSKLDENPRAKEVADKLQEFMGTRGAELGNEISMARWGIRQFGIKDYYPLKVSEGTVTPKNEKDEKLDGPHKFLVILSKSFTKKRSELKPTESIELDSILNTFSNHMSEMIIYNSMALPVLDAYKWFNYKGQTDLGEQYGVEMSMLNAFGDVGTHYFKTLLEDISGSTHSVARDRVASRFIKNSKIASVGANLRVIALQPTSYHKALAEIDAKYLLRGIRLSEVVTRKNIKKAKKYCGIALWKSMGYYDINIGRGVQEKIKHAETRKDKLVELSMKGAEIADEVTWGFLWNACELEIRDKRKELKVGSEEFYREVGKRLRDIIYATQVVDSTLTRSQMMRSPDTNDKNLTMFMSEPTLALNMVTDAFVTYKLDKQRMGKDAAKKKHGKRIARVLTAYTLTNAVAALVETAFDWLRDDDDDEEMNLALQYMINFALDMGLVGKIPYFKEIVSQMRGFSSNRTETQWMQSAFWAAKNWAKIFSGDAEGQGSKAVQNTLRTISDILGLPIYNAFRDIMAITNKLDLFTTEDLNEMFEDFFD